MCAPCSSQISDWILWKLLLTSFLCWGFVKKLKLKHYIKLNSSFLIRCTIAKDRKNFWKFWETSEKFPKLSDGKLAACWPKIKRFGVNSSKSSGLELTAGIGLALSDCSTRHSLVSGTSSVTLLLPRICYTKHIRHS